MRCGGGRGGVQQRAGGAGRRAVAAAGVAGAGEEGDSGGFVRAAQAMKNLGEWPRSKRGKRGS